MIIIFILIVIALVILNPLWLILDLHVPGRPEIKIDFTQPVDTFFYIQNTIEGYKWETGEPTSIWFHPLLVWFNRILSNSLIPMNYQFWIVSLLSGFFSTFLIFEYIDEISITTPSVWYLLLVPIIPGAMGIATGNAEIPCLLFNFLLLLSVIKKQHFIFPLLWGALAILTKPNAVYMIPPLIVYLFDGWISKDNRLYRNSILAILGILVAFMLWTLFVDIQTGNWGNYWKIRSIGSTTPSFIGVWEFFTNFATSLITPNNFALQLRYLVAIVVPLVDIWLLTVIPVRNEIHKLSLLAGFMTILLITILINNPNKVIVYSTTIPGHFLINILFFQFAFKKIDGKLTIKKILPLVLGVVYFIYCLLMMLFYILGTPLEWYY